MYVLAWSCGRAKCQCCTATVTVVVSTILLKMNIDILICRLFIANLALHLSNGLELETLLSLDATELLDIQQLKSCKEPSST